MSTPSVPHLAVVFSSVLGGCATPLAPGQAATFPAEVADLAAANEALGDPYRGRFPYDEAVSGLADAGVLRATLHTEEGTIDCVLAPDSAPLTVANFVGLARGLRPFKAEDGRWVRQPYYEGIPWHRAQDGQFVQTGRRGRLATGGFLLQDEISLGDSFDRPGVLAMGNTGEPDSGSVQFFITTAPAKHLAGHHTIFGQCDAEATVRRLQRRVNSGGAPILHRIEVTRGAPTPTSSSP